MINGTGEHIEVPAHSDEMSEPSVLQVNFKIGWKQVGMAFAMVFSALTTLTAAGWLALPAKQSDMTEVQHSLVIIAQDLKATRVATDALSQTVLELTRTVKTLQSAGGRVKSR